ncbi:MAG: glucose-6-phosphate dehydrogenase assembly protein OpcA [Polyangiaceae bacterium]
MTAIAVEERPGVVLNRVDAELRALWATQPGETPKARACTMNLVVVAATPALATQWLPVIDEVLLGTPARAIVAGLAPDGVDGLEATTTAVCAPGNGGPLTCSERVALVARGAVCAHLPSCVAALCATDVPTTLVWLGDIRPGDATFEQLARDASRIVLDVTEGSLGSLARAVSWARARAAADRPGVADRAWTRLAPWQEMCARMFDAPRLRAAASHMTRVTLVQACDAGAMLGAEGILFVGWLATRLGWKRGDPPGRAGALTFVREDGGKVELVIAASATSRAPRQALVAVRIEASADAIAVRGEIARETDDADSATWRLEVTRTGAAEQHPPERIEQHVRLPATGTARLLERTLHRRTVDAALADSAAWADGFGGEELACGEEGDNVRRA